MLWQGQTKSNEGFLGPMEEGVPLCSEGDSAVVRTLRTEHCFVTCDAVLIFFAVPKNQKKKTKKKQLITFFEIGIENWQSSSLPLFV